MAGLYDPATGGIRVTVVDGSSYVGLWASDGSWNVIVSNGTWAPTAHPCGAIRITACLPSDNRGYYAPDGSCYVYELSTAVSTLGSTVVSFGGLLANLAITSTPGPESLDFSDANNSQYLILLEDI